MLLSTFALTTSGGAAISILLEKGMIMEMEKDAVC
jgi:hypothetical protein